MNLRSEESTKFTGLAPCILGALCPSKSGLINRHTVKHTVKPTNQPTNQPTKQFGLVWWVKSTVRYRNS